MFPQTWSCFLEVPPLGSPVVSLNPLTCWGRGGSLPFRNELSLAGLRLQDVYLLNSKHLTTPPAQRKTTITTQKYALHNT